MPVNVGDLLTRLQNSKHESGWQDDTPIRAEIFGILRMREHAESLASHQPVVEGFTSTKALLDRISGNFATLNEAHEILLDVVASGETITPAAEWLIDNFHTAEQHIQQALEDLPAGYYRQLPKLASGHLKGYPQVLGIAWAYIAHTDSNFEAATLSEFVNSYQSVSPLTIGELWALAIHLRILLIENATRVARRTVVSRGARTKADALAEGLFGGEATLAQSEAMAAPLPDHAKLSFMVQLMKRLRDKRDLDPAAMTQLRDIVLRSGYDFDSAAHEEHARQTANNVTMQNIFTSLKRIAEQDWEAWFETVSLVEKAFAGNAPYQSLDTASRTTYRSAIEDLARHSQVSEVEVAEKILQVVESGDPGQILLGGKRSEFEKLIGYKATFLRRVRTIVRNTGVSGYAAAIAAVAFIIVAIGLSSTQTAPLSWAAWAVLALCALAPAFDAAMAMVNYAVTQLMRPMVLPAYAFDQGIPPKHRTLIAVPVMITSFHGIDEMVERLETHFLANDDEQLFYALISDWKDAPAEFLQEDQDLLDAALTGIRQLNLRHGHHRFMLLHRARRWNAAEAVWMGWERKRGKLHELNRLLRGAADTSFVNVPANLPQSVTYVIVLDADTLLPRNAARKLAGKMAHPLNEPVLDPATGRVTSGYGIMQPRVTISLPGRGQGTLYQQIYSSRPGLDPYVFAVSDVYQDLFGEGSFTGKGIYHIDAFEAAVAGRIPENAMLSHDLFEGNFARAGLVSDVQVVEDFPERYVVDMARHHRWARGDWQLLPWMFPPARGLSALGFWKMLDNLRRSITPILTLASLVLSWIMLPSTVAVAWTVFLSVVLFLPAFLPIFAGSSLRREPITTESQVRTLLDDIASSIKLTLARVAFLAHQSFVMADAMARTIYRLTVSRRYFLEWTAAAQLQSSLASALGGTYRLMAASPIIGGLILAAAIMPGSGLSFIAIPFALAWIAAPAIAFYFSRPLIIQTFSTADGDWNASLRKVALRTWRYFDAHVVAAENMLPPDNFQEDPQPAVAHRTSPTNIGLYLLSTVSAYELGWIGAEEALRRLQATVATVKRLEMYRGHLFNWYDTVSLQPLEPRYVSTVDSGNFAGHLIAVANACETWTERPSIRAERLSGIIDAARLVADIAARIGHKYRRLHEQAERAGEHIKALVRVLSALQAAPELIPLRMVGVGAQISSIGQSFNRLFEGGAAEEKADGTYWIGILRNSVEAMLGETMPGANHSSDLNRHFLTLAEECRTLAYAMDFQFLVNHQRHLLSIGYRMDDESLDQSCYDLLASEASLTSFFAIAKSDVGSEHWVRLGRPVVAVERSACLVSWSGSMFEYLMPYLVLKSPDETLNKQSMELVVAKQMTHGVAKDTPWGISESAYAARDLHFTYQYSNFGVPGLGLKRGLADNHVIAPYATGLAAMIAPSDAASNYVRLESLGGAGRFGFYEAIDFTLARLRTGQPHEIIRAYFAHHQGMTITAIHNAVSGGALREFFHRENRIKATELLLQERAPHHLPVKTVTLGGKSPQKMQPPPVIDVSRRVDPRIAAEPVTQLLSNGRYSVMLTQTGAGYSRWNGIAISRWREDPTLNEWGMRILLRDMDTGNRWTAAYAHRLSAPSHAEAIFNQEKAEFHRVDLGITTVLECMVSTEDDAEARCLRLVNTSGESRSIEYTTYMELALAYPAADDAHPAFSKLFIQTEYVPELQAVVAMRRHRQAGDAAIWVAQFVISDNETASDLEFETSREKFLGRGNSADNATAMERGSKLSGATGSVLDSIIALRQRVTLLPHQRMQSVIWTIVAETRESLIEKVERYRSMSVYDRVQVLAWTQSRILLRHLSIDVEEANAFQDAASALIYSSRRFRPAPAAIAAGMKPQAALWPLSISGTKPILLIRITDIDDIALVEQVFRAQDYWLEKRLAVDIVILNERRTSYLQDLQTVLDDLAARARISRSYESTGERGQIFVLRADLIAAETVTMLSSVAHVVFHAAHGKLDEQLKVVPRRYLSPMPRRTRLPASRAAGVPQQQPEGLSFFNGYGGFDNLTGEYAVLHSRERPLPGPWINVIANPRLGTHCSAEGGGYTWFANSRERQISAWSNDPITDRPSEIFYLRDADSGTLASPTVQPLGRRDGEFSARHGLGFTTYQGRELELAMELTATVAPEDAVKLSRLTITNLSGRRRELHVSFYAEVVLGQRRAASAHFVTSELDPASDALFLRNRWSPDFAETVVFADFSKGRSSWTANRSAVLGPRGGIEMPEGLLRAAPLGGESGGGYDPCIALQSDVTLEAGASIEIILMLGAADTPAEAEKLVSRYRATAFDDVLQRVRQNWQEVTGHLQVRTPDQSFNLMMNGWLIYQTLSCRMWARSGFYQASGAYGFRDQLQDSLTLAHVKPDLARHHILTAASRQFAEGDVQHWWLPETGAGVRTRISDDTAWLAYCTAYYVELTGDAGILDETVPFLTGRLLEEHEHDAFFIPGNAPEAATLYAHCVLGLSRNLPGGSHDLPFMGTGDWNDGMNEVGQHGRGESIWLGWFLYTTLNAFEKLAAARGDERHVAAWQSRREELAKSLDAGGWDGAWYRRAYFDDGTPLGSAANEECRIDTIAQSWAVISGAADPAKARMAMENVERYLIDEKYGLALLFTPPFRNSNPTPGYIQSYPAGVRENGGQYTHGALWAIFAYAKLRESEKAARLFSLINPINHALSEADAARYRVEPYVMAADIYSISPHRGRGGWTWYTGAAGWSYRAGLEAILGFKRNGSKLAIRPNVPAAWKDYEVSYRFAEKTITFAFVRAGGDAIVPEAGTSEFEFDLEGIADGERVTLRL